MHELYYWEAYIEIPGEKPECFCSGNYFTETEQTENIDRFISKVRKYLNLDELTPAVLNDMVKAVYVHAPDKSSGHREQQIDISYDLVGILPASLLNDLQNGETA